MERRVHSNEEPGINGDMTLAFDVATGQVRCSASGFWSVRQAEAFFDDWVDAIGRIHGAGHAVSALVDMSDSAVQKAEVAAIVARRTEALYAESDAIAMLVPTSLAKMQMRRVLDARVHAFFLSRSAAETWLQGRALLQDRQRPAIGHVA